MAFFTGGRFRELMKKYGKVALGVHFTVSAASITGLYIAIRNNVDVESLLDKLHMGGVSAKDDGAGSNPKPNELVFEETGNQPSTTAAVVVGEEKKRNRTAELAASSGGALALAVLCNKALFPIRVPITVALTPSIARFLARRKIIKSGV
ncbi:hypothetical protein TorRG33x02_142420 [Trema orientale]|uniref:DUF1279 domain-containing protein n=1 Tax=Trema orientale TaxID=63057 RepID=A0A2P5EWN6_TREOI|nr:hypothetical protein TorRG33x02_142420 [Trema orientale]